MTNRDVTFGVTGKNTLVVSFWVYNHMSAVSFYFIWKYCLIKSKPSEVSTAESGLSAGAKHPCGRALGSRIPEFVFDVAYFAPSPLWTLFIWHKSSSSPGGWSPSNLFVFHLFPLQRPELVLCGETLTLKSPLPQITLSAVDWTICNSTDNCLTKGTPAQPVPTAT